MFFWLSEEGREKFDFFVLFFLVWMEDCVCFGGRGVGGGGSRIEVRIFLIYFEV